MSDFQDKRLGEQPDDQRDHSSVPNWEKLKFEWRNFGLPPGVEARPQIVDKLVWKIAKRVGEEPREEDLLGRAVYWAGVVKLYQEMGGRFNWIPPTAPENN
jgi:hypothetical protein